LNAPSVTVPSVGSDVGIVVFSETMADVLKAVLFGTFNGLPLSLLRRVAPAASTPEPSTMCHTTKS
jgi:hypothetical protein